MPPRFSRKTIEEIYATHPLRKDTIVCRLLRDRRSLEGLTERDLAEDAVTQITDQNHMGGLEYTRRLAEQVGVSSGQRVLDLGCGLGGSARALASIYGARVHGIDLSAQRILDAEELTALVGLRHLVSFECADVMTVPLPSDRADVIWGQGAWSQFEQKNDFLTKWRQALLPGGRLALEDVCLLRQPVDDAERTLLTSLEDHWTSYLLARDGDTGWTSLIERSGFSNVAVEDCSADLLEHFVSLRAGSAQLEEAVGEFEQRAWQLAIQATEAALVGYFRVVAERNRP